jgi:hypothetical protein
MNQISIILDKLRKNQPRPVWALATTEEIGLGWF